MRAGGGLVWISLTVLQTSSMKEKERLIDTAQDVSKEREFRQGRLLKINYFSTLILLLCMPI